MGTGGAHRNEDLGALAGDEHDLIDRLWRVQAPPIGGDQMKGEAIEAQGVVARRTRVHDAPMLEGAGPGTDARLG
jgi:hypothetical protein